METPIPDWLSRHELRKYSGPPVGQITAAVVDAINRADTRAGDRLPPVRKLAEHLGIAVNTVAKAYKRLEEWKLVEGRGRAGTLVSTDANQLRGEIQQLVCQLVTRASRAGLGTAELHQMVDAAAARCERPLVAVPRAEPSNTRSTMLAS